MKTSLMSLFASAGLCAVPALARDFRVNQLPNGSAIGCAACHLNLNGGGARNPFGLAVQAITGSANKAFWSATLAAKDSDGDGFSNGVELGDPEGDGTAIAGWVPKNPGSASSKPANQAPTFTSTPVDSAFLGEPYSYTATATDPEAGLLTFSKVDGPVWLAVSAAGVVSGTPPDLAAGDFNVVLKVTDSGSPAQSVDQSYTLKVRSRYAGWAATRFNLPAEAALSGALVDAEGDGVVNLAEYALRGNPRVADAPAVKLPEFLPNGGVVLSVAVRDDDPALTVEMEVAEDANFTAPQTVTGVASDPTPGDGLKTLEFTDPLPATQFGQLRFWRLKLQLAP